MKKITILILFIFLSVVTAHATEVSYRISSGEVMEISVENGTDFGMDSVYFGVLTDPPFTNGTQWLGPNYESRLIGYSKINDNGTIRNATQEEIDGFLPAAIDDKNKKEAAKSIDYMLNDPRFRRIMIALLDILVTRFNAVHQWDMDLKAAVEASTSLADFKSRVAALGNLPTDLDLSDVKTAIENRINKND